jgi:hypothetical protein
VAAAGLLIGGLERWRWIGRALLALQDTTAQIRVRAAVALLMGFAALATGFGLEAILGAFLAGATISLLDRDRALTHQQFRTKLQAVGFGALIPYFFIATGMSPAAGLAAPGADRRAAPGHQPEHPDRRRVDRRQPRADPPGELPRPGRRRAGVSDRLPGYRRGPDGA